MEFALVTRQAILAFDKDCVELMRLRGGEEALIRGTLANRA